MSWLCCFWAVISTKNFKLFNSMIQKSMIGKFYIRILNQILHKYSTLLLKGERIRKFRIKNFISILYDEFGVDCDLIDKLFYFFNRQSLLLAGKQDIKLYSILAGIILFAPDRGLSKLSYRKSKARPRVIFSENAVQYNMILIDKLRSQLYRPDTKYTRRMFWSFTRICRKISVFWEKFTSGGKILDWWLISDEPIS